MFDIKKFSYLKIKTENQIKKNYVKRCIDMICFNIKKVVYLFIKSLTYAHLNSSCIIFLMNNFFFQNKIKLERIIKFSSSSTDCKK